MLARADSAAFNLALAAWDDAIASTAYPPLMRRVLAVHRRGLVLAIECGMRPVQVKTEVIGYRSMVAVTEVARGFLRIPIIVGRPVSAARVGVYPPWPNRPLPGLPAGWTVRGSVVEYREDM